MQPVPDMRAHFTAGPVPALLAKGILLWSCMQTSEGLANEVPAGGSAPLTFDADILRQRGIDPGLIEYLRDGARFAPGVHAVTLKVNDLSRGRVEARFQADGQLCFDNTLLDAAGLQLPGDEKGADPARCRDFVGTYEQTRVNLDPQGAEVALVVPTQALRAPENRQDLSAYHTGGMAGVFNYELLALRNQFDGQNSDYWSANTELGFNAGDWIVRSQQIHTAVDGDARTEHLDAYAQRTFAQLGTVLQAGQISMANPVLAGARITGVQLLSEQALMVPASNAPIEGIAHSQARVEVRQAGALVYSTVVPAGPFALAGLPRLDRRTDLEVTVIEAGGEQRSFIVPAAMLALDLPAPGFVLSAGHVRDGGGADQEPWVVSGGWSQALKGTTTLSSGLMASEDYHAGGLGLGVQPWDGAQAQWLMQASRAAREGVRGVQTQVSLSQRLSEAWSVNAAAAQQTSGYRDLIDVQLDFDEASERGRYRNQFSAGVSWAQPWLGSLSAGYSQSALFDGRQSGRSYASWGQRFGQVSVSASAEWNLGGDNGLDNAVYLSVSVPLGERRRLRTSLRNSGGENRYGVSLQEQLSDTASYRLGAEHDSRDGEVDLNAGVSLLPRYAQLELGYTGYGNGNRGYSAGLRGGMAVHADGVTLSPYPVQDTFALLSVGEVSGVKVSTPNGPVWTDGNGQAVIAQLSPYGNSPVEVQTKTLPRNIDINNGATVVQAGRGAVARVDFGVVTTRRVLLQSTHVDGHPLPAGAVVTDGKGEFVTLVQEGGLVFAGNVELNPRLWVKVPDEPACELHFTLPDTPDLQAYYETTPAVCRTP